MSIEGRLDLQRRLLGHTLKLAPIAPGVDHGRDLVITGPAGGKAPASVEGVDCFAQDMEVALTTALGSDPFNVGFGFDGLTALATETIPVLVRERVRIAVVQVLRRDPRVRNVLDVRLDVESGSALPLRASRAMAIRVEVELVTGTVIGVSTGLAGFARE